MESAKFGTDWLSGARLEGAEATEPGVEMTSVNVEDLYYKWPVSEAWEHILKSSCSYT